MYMGGQSLAGNTLPGGIKGFSTFLRWKASNWATHTLVQKVAAKDGIVFDDVVLDWDGVTIPSYP